ncbi:MAG: DegT/DnrJ/EryC1/StrS family aminotransferase [Bacteroidota bacterium]|nr:DegT/DnrJ/EryC1/StrS family aminotransferase [Bacteroidota bacterium]
MNRHKIPLAKPSFDGREVEAIKRVIQGGWVVQGPEVEDFENLIAEMHGARNCIAVTSGTAALHICYLVLGIGPGDAVFMPSFAWPSAANMAMAVGAQPVFVDVLPETYNIDPIDLRIKIQQCLENNIGKPRAVVPVHEFGLAADMNAVTAVACEFGLEVIEDAACALGAYHKGSPVGTIGKMGIFSFHPRKAITTGEGGAIVTNDDELAHECRVWRNHGQSVLEGKKEFQLAGMNYRMTEIQAAIGKVQLSKFPEILNKRMDVAQSYFEKLNKNTSIKLPTNCAEHTWQTFMVVLTDNCDRDNVVDAMSKAGFECGLGSIAGHCAKIYREKFNYKPDDLPVSERLYSQGLALPLHTFLAKSDIVRCALSLIQAVSEK